MALQILFLFSFFSLFKKKLKTLHVKPASFPRFFSFSLFSTLGVGLLSPGVGTWMIVMETRVNSRFQNKSFRLYWLQKKKNFFVSMVTHIQVHVHRRKVYPISSHPLLSRNTWKLKRTKKIFFSFFFPIWKIFFLGRKVCVSRVMCPKSSLFWLSYKFSFYKNRSSCPITPISFSLSLSLHYF